MQSDTNGTVSHEIIVGTQSVQATSDINGSIVLLTNDGVQTTYSDENLSLEVNSTITGKATYSIKVGTKTTQATSLAVGATTLVGKDSDGDIEITTSIAINRANISVKAKADGSAVYEVNGSAFETKVTSVIQGAQTLIKESGEVKTQVDGETSLIDGSYIRAVVSTKTNGTSQSKFVRYNSNGEEQEVLETLPAQEFSGNNDVTIQSNPTTGQPQMIIIAPISSDNIRF